MMRYIIAVTLALLFSAAHAQQTPNLANVIIHREEGKLSLTLEVAADPETRKIGLMNRKHIGLFQGMVFLFPEAKDYEFWMSNTYIPLDMIFVDASGKIAHIEHEVEPLTLQGRSAKTLIKSVIELQGGTARAEHIREGDYVEYNFTQPVDVR